MNKYLIKTREVKNYMGSNGGTLSQATNGPVLFLILTKTKQFKKQGLYVLLFFPQQIAKNKFRG